MGIFDRLKKQDKTEKQEEKELKQDSVQDSDTEKKEESQQTHALSRTSAGTAAFHIISKPHISEKGTLISGLGKYVFEVHPKANKSEVKKAVERIYKVHVKKVNIILLAGKMRRYGRSMGRTNTRKKAIVTLAPGERIEGVTATETA